MEPVTHLLTGACLSRTGLNRKAAYASLTIYPKPGRSAAVLTAERSKLGRVYMDWSPMPFVQVTKADTDLASGGAEPAAAATVVTFQDPRFLGGRLSDSGRHSLLGTVELDAAGHVVLQTMDGRVER
jgi:inner membrane protein